MTGRRNLIAALAGLLSMVVLATGCGSDSDSPSTETDVAVASMRDPALLDGSVTYLQRIALPKDAVVVIGLYDLARGVSPAGLVAEHRFQAGTQVPIAFQLPYDRARLSASRDYGVQARILVDGALWFVNEQPVPVLTRGNPASAQILVRPSTTGD